MSSYNFHSMIYKYVLWEERGAWEYLAPILRGSAGSLGIEACCVEAVPQCSACAWCGTLAASGSVCAAAASDMALGKDTIDLICA